jgi:hypothetical protein
MVVTGAWDKSQFRRLVVALVMEDERRAERVPLANSTLVTFVRSRIVP